MFSKTKQLQKNDRLREPALKKPERLREPSQKKTERLREAVPKKTERLRPSAEKNTVRLREKPTEKATRIKEKPLKNSAYLQWFHSQNYGCLVCGSNNIEAHHVLRGVDGRSDDSIVPLCPEHHRGRYGPHGFDSDKFSEEYSKELLMAIAKRLYEAFESELFN